MKGTAFSPHEGIYIQHLKTSKKNDMPVQHYHDAYEIYLQLAGKRYFFFDNICYILERGDMLILKPFDIHYAESRESEYYERYVLNFQSDVLNSVLSKEEAYILLEEKLNQCVVHLSEEQTGELFEYYSRADEYTKQTGFLSGKLQSSAVLQLVVKALSYTDNNFALKGEKVSSQIIDALRYMNKHYKEIISLDDISEAAHMSKYYLCRKFRDVTGATVLEYLDNVRLTRVHNLLVNETMTLDEIAEETGFSSAVNLSRVFKKVYGVSPREFRKNNRK